MTAYDLRCTAEQLAAAAAWALPGEGMADVCLLADGSMLLVTQGDDQAAFGTGGEPASEEYFAAAPLDREGGTVTAYSKLQDAMDFDHVIEVRADGTIGEPEPGLYAPEVTVLLDGDGQITADAELDMIGDVRDQGWELLDGYTGQHGYRGAIMHPSEFIGGRLAGDILARAGLYAAVEVTALPADGSEADDVPAGWVVAKKEAP